MTSQMTSHVLIVNIGPVQDFIAQARRTRDLWFGSHVLSEVSKAAAGAIAEQPDARLIFPALARGDHRLEEWDEVRRPRGAQKDHWEMPYNVANKIVAVIGKDGDPRRAALAARERAQQRLLAMWKNTQSQLSELVAEGSDAAALEQIATLLEVRAVWASFDAADDHGYADARRHAEEDLARRKTLHGFSPWQKQRRGAFKSSLDGARESVLRAVDQNERRSSKVWRRFRIRLREELDAVGLLKRTGGMTDQFVPIPTIGLAAWIQRASKEPGVEPEWQALRNKMDRLRKDHKDKAAFPRVRTPHSWLEQFPYDAQVLLADRWQPHFCDVLGAEHKDQRQQVSREAARFGRQYVMPLHGKLDEPFPYVACLVADGDHMGNAIDDLARPESHCSLSAALASFAREAYDIVEKNHRGVLVYAGGDDVLAFVCVQDAFSCADELRRRFAAIVGQTIEDAEVTCVARPTLSVGLGIGHVLQSLGHLLHLGRRAEKLAKHPDRNALGVLFERHAGALRTWRRSWADDPVQRMSKAVLQLAEDRLSAGKVHEIDALARRLPGPDEGSVEFSLVLRSEIERILARNEAGPVRPGDVFLDLGDDDYATLLARVDEWVQFMLIALDLHRAHQTAEIHWQRQPARGGE